MAFRISSWPGSAQVYRFSFTYTTSGMVFAYLATAWMSTVPAMFKPQWQTKTPTRKGSGCVAASFGFCVCGLLILQPPQQSFFFQPSGPSFLGSSGFQDNLLVFLMRYISFFDGNISIPWGKQEFAWKTDLIEYLIFLRYITFQQLANRKKPSKPANSTIQKMQRWKTLRAPKLQKFLQIKLKIKKEKLLI